MLGAVSRYLNKLARVRTYLLRRVIAGLYIRGDGIEIGALSHPLRVSRRARVKYVDRMTASALKKQYPELGTAELTGVDIVDDGERLESIQDSTQDFVIANHFIEHCQNPIGTIRNMIRVLKREGVLYLAIPDKRHTFDVNRPVTPIAHLIKDDRDGPEWSKRQHYQEYARLVDKVQGDQTESHVARLMDKDASIHYHVWKQTEMFELLLTLKKGLEFDVDLVFRHANEVIFILRKG